MEGAGSMRAPAAATRRVGFVEVGPRDGLQNESAILSTAQKCDLIGQLVAAGIQRIEVASFARADRVPQMADAEAVIAALPDWDDVITIGLVMNLRGAERALATKVRELGAVAVASDVFAQRNQRQTAAETLASAAAIVARAREAGRRGQITIGAAFGCPFTGEVDPALVIDMAKRAADSQPEEVALADTIGCAVPGQVADLVGRVREAIAPLPVRGHFHNTRNTGVANVWAAIEAGAATVDGSVGGLGGCPFAPGAAGNVPTEDVLYLLDRSHVATGMDLDRVIDIAGWLSRAVGRSLPGMVSRAGRFPKPELQTQGDKVEWATA
jgi:hydroxymethylglutaryl-CoA lyase